MKLTLKVLIGNLLFIAVFFLIIARIFSVVSGAVFPVDIVTSDSMSPSLITGDLVTWSPASIQDVKVGDIVVYKSWLHWPDTKFIVHRVIEVREDFGKIALVTKGDANRWTDQAGPHAPEPYVTEKNFVGKAIMLGPVPLKIPLVGYVGILVNEGFRLLTQSSAAKGTSTTIWVFTPLTVSVILLVIAIFLVPERRKTIQEKIRYYILSSRSLNLKKTAVFFFLLFTAFFFIIHLFAYDTVTGAVGVGEFASKNGMDLGALEPGQTGFPREISVVNPSVFPVKGIIFGRQGMEPLLNHVVFTVGAGKIKPQNISASVPNGTANGSYVGDIAIYSSPLWLLFPDEVLLTVSQADPSLVVIILDLISAAILTAVTLLIILAAALLEETAYVLQVNLSWHYAPRPMLKTRWRARIAHARLRFRRGLARNVLWVSQVNLASLQARPFLIGGLIAVPFFFLMQSTLTALVVAAVLAGLVAYLFRCRLREKIVLAVVMSLCVSLCLLMGKIGFDILTASRSVIETLGLVMGALGIYLLVVAFLLVPVVLTSWGLTHLCRNVKEQRDPLLALEGGCDL